MTATPEGAVVASQNINDSVDSEMRAVEEVEIPQEDAMKIIKDQVLIVRTDWKVTVFD
jgi:hypothetical protein